MRELHRGSRQLTIGLLSMLCIRILSSNLKLRRHNSRIRLYSSKRQWGSPGIILYSNSNSHERNTNRTLSPLSPTLITASTPQFLLLLGNQTRCRLHLDTQIPLNIKPNNKLRSISKAKCRLILFPSIHPRARLSPHSHISRATSIRNNFLSKTLSLLVRPNHNTNRNSSNKPDSSNRNIPLAPHSLQCNIRCRRAIPRTSCQTPSTSLMTISRIPSPEFPIKQSTRHFSMRWLGHQLRRTLSPVIFPSVVRWTLKDMMGFSIISRMISQFSHN